MYSRRNLMKITKSQLRQIIQEELQNVLYEQTAPIFTEPDPPSDADSPTYSTGDLGMRAGREEHTLPATLVQPREQAKFEPLYTGPGTQTSQQQVADYQRNDALRMLHRLAELPDDNKHKAQYIQTQIARLGGTTEGLDDQQVSWLADKGIVLRQSDRDRLVAAGKTMTPSSELAAAAPAAAPAAPAAPAAAAGDGVQRDERGRPVLPRNWRSLPANHPQRVAVRQYRAQRRRRA